MSLRAHIWAMDNAPVRNPTAALILIALADEANDDGQGAAPYMDKLVQRGRCSERSVQEHLRNLFRARLISLGDPLVARQRYRKTNGRLPRVWDLNMSASWAAAPEPRTDEEMLAYSDKIGQRPVRRSTDQAEREGVQDLHPSDDPLEAGVQILHPSGDTPSDQARQSEVDEEDQEEGCSPPHPSRLSPLVPRLIPPPPNRTSLWERGWTSRRRGRIPTRKTRRGTLPGNGPWTRPSPGSSTGAATGSSGTPAPSVRR